jgi:hypothetical protein
MTGEAPLISKRATRSGNLGEEGEPLEYPLPMESVALVDRYIREFLQGRQAHDHPRD